MPNFVEVNHNIISMDKIETVNISQLRTHTIVVTLTTGETIEVTGFAALSIVWTIQPSWLEGKSFIKWNKHAWAIHNIIAHPLMQVLAWCKMYKRAMWIHDITVPRPIGYKHGK